MKNQTHRQLDMINPELFDLSAEMPTAPAAPKPAPLSTLAGFIGRAQLACVRDGLQGEESGYFCAKVVELAAIIDAMPRTYEQDGKGLQAVAHLHYFTGGCDWYITEKDKGHKDDEPEDFQRQAFGMANLGYGGELGYISIPEILANGGELDFHWTPKTLAQVSKARS